MSTTKKPVILIVDDDPEFHQNMVFAFSEYTLISAYEEEGAMEVAKCININLLLCDLNLDDRSDEFDRGKELIHWVAKENPQLPIIAVTNYHEQKDEFTPVGKFGATSLLFKKDYEVKNWKDTFEKYLHDK